MANESKICADMVQIIEGLRGRYPDLRLLFHIDNEGKRRPWVAKRKGIKPGVPDYCLPVPRGGYLGCFFEMKATGKQVKSGSSQDKWLRTLEYNGYFTFWTDDAQTAVDKLVKYIRGEICR